MRKILVLILAVFFISCESFEHESEFDKSFQKWKSFKNSSNNSYKYVVSGSSWSGSSWETEILVNSGEVTERNFKYTSWETLARPLAGWDKSSDELFKEKYPEMPQDHLTELLRSLEWSERKIELGTHKGTPAFDLWTLDQIYAKAKDEWLVKRDDVTTSFETKNNGMISSCGFIPNNCADDCFRGVSIRLIEAL